MRGHDDLANRGLLHPAHQLEEFHLARRRQRRFRFVEDEDALALATLLEEPHKAFAVRMGEEIRRRAASPVEISRDGEETLGPEEPAVGDLRQPAGTQRFGKLAARDLDRIGMIDRPITLAAAGFVISGQHRDPLQQRRLSGPVFAGNDGDRAIKAELKVVMEKRQAKWIGLAVGDARRIEPDPLQIRRRHVDGAISP